MSIVAIVPAAGSGKRMRSKTEKQFLPLNGCPLIVHTLAKLQQSRSINRIILAVARDRTAYVKKDIIKRFGLDKVTDVTIGARERYQTVQNALKKVKSNEHYVLIHDAVRPFISDHQIQNVVKAAKRYGASTLGVPVSETLKLARNGLVAVTKDRKNLWRIQTPQVFKKSLLTEAFRRAVKNNDFGTDECYIVEKLGHTVKLVEGAPENMKITTRDDLKFAKKLLDASHADIRVGTGFDVHQLVTGRNLIIGGIKLKFPLGLLGHSDADVLCHAVGDALLGATAQGDIGRHFPNTDRRYKGISSLKLLARIKDLLEKSFYRILNIDATVVAQKPKLSPHIRKMRTRIAASLALPVERVSIKATTTEGLGFEGEIKGISAQATALVAKSC